MTGPAVIGPTVIGACSPLPFAAVTVAGAGAGVGVAEVGAAGVDSCVVATGSVVAGGLVGAAGCSAAGSDGRADVVAALRLCDGPAAGAVPAIGTDWPSLVLPAVVDREGGTIVVGTAAAAVDEPLVDDDSADDEPLAGPLGASEGADGPASLGESVDDALEDPAPPLGWSGRGTIGDCG